MAMVFPLPSLLLLLSLITITLHTGTALPQRNRYITWKDINIDEKKAYVLSTRDRARTQGRVIVVSQDGRGDSRTVQGAINMVPDGNKKRVKILIHSGVYREKVTIPITKPHISFIGLGKNPPVISWNSKASDIDSMGQQVGTFYSATVAVDSDYFVANRITFENTSPGAVPGSVGKQAAALRLSGDKAVLYRCRILGTQDTLFDHYGRHFFYQCHIQGSIDFIFGNARSLYQGCILHVTASYYGAIAAQQRNSPSEKSGFSFLDCRITGSGQAVYLGRAWGRYASIVYAFCQIDNIIAPEGWYDWNDPSRRSTVFFAEYNNVGPGARSRPRVSWERTLTDKQARQFIGQNYIDGNEWLRL
ncbi:hypothetical protein LUZ60_006448 [Juncus effusus]|nr:hypothetical protein LUZ60_006448 [Juncus effusus]